MNPNRHASAAKRAAHPPGSISRRLFLKGALAAGAGVGFPTIIPGSALGAGGAVAPSNRIVMGAIGLGGMGMGNMQSFLANADVQFVAVCDVDSEHLARAKETVDKRYGNADCAAYADFRDLIGRGDLDAVSLALPDHWHAIPAIAAARAGLDIYGEKPLARSIREGQAIRAAVQRYERVWQTGSWQRSKDDFHRACELVINGRIGAVHKVEVGLGGGPVVPLQPLKEPPKSLDWDFWLGPAPWRPYCDFGSDLGKVHWNWRWILDYSGGQLTDWSGHHIDIAHWGLGLDLSGPVEIEGKGTYPENALSTAPSQYRFACKYATGMEMTVASDLPMGTHWFGETGEVFVTRGKLWTKPEGLIDSRIEPGETRLYRSRDHHRNFLDCVKTRKTTITPVEIAHRSISVGLLGEIAMLTGRKIRWNPDTEEIVGDPGAGALLGRSYREPWTL
ncbi:MAG: Inositol 2-dehydrogenase [candidate division BRC1 bacterium ADurb.BinA364]|nr:MAG: Inositol 2-dehydrogenase [candidate division BRC1 bacterium ADurb.BinA364]